jgi:hypothetical protein
MGNNDDAVKALIEFVRQLASGDIETETNLSAHLPAWLLRRWQS